MSSELPSTQPALGHLGMKTVVLSGQQVPWQAAHLQSREVRVKQLQPRLPPCPNHKPGQAVIMTPGSRYKGKTASLPGQRRNQSPHCCSVPLESSGMDLPARKPAHPCSWACLPPRGTQVSHIDITFCAQVEARWAAVNRSLPAHSVEEGGEVRVTAINTEGSTPVWCESY